MSFGSSCRLEPRRFTNLELIGFIVLLHLPVLESRASEQEGRRSRHDRGTDWKLLTLHHGHELYLIARSKNFSSSELEVTHLRTSLDLEDIIEVAFLKPFLPDFFSNDGACGSRVNNSHARAKRHEVYLLLIEVA